MVDHYTENAHSELRLTKGWTAGERIPVGRDIPPVQTGPGGPPSLLYNGYRVFPGG